MKTFLRQKVTLAAAKGRSIYLDDRKEPKSTPVQKQCRPVNPSWGDANPSKVVEVIHTLGPKNQNSKVIQNERSHFTGCVYKGDNQRYTPMGKRGEINKKSLHRPTNENTAGVLRYALHLRFLCLSKKSSKSFQRCKFDPLSSPQTNNLDIGGERRFYLYNDLRVVFPQRHSDADEGKVFHLLLSL